MDEFLTSKETAARLRVHVRTLAKWRELRRIPYIQSEEYGSRVKYHWPSVRDAIMKHQREVLNLQDARKVVVDGSDLVKKVLEEEAKKEKGGDELVS